MTPPLTRPIRQLFSHPDPFPCRLQNFSCPCPVPDPICHFFSHPDPARPRHYFRIFSLPTPPRFPPPSGRGSGVGSGSWLGWVRSLPTNITFKGGVEENVWEPLYWLVYIERSSSAVEKWISIHIQFWQRTGGFELFVCKHLIMKWTVMSVFKLSRFIFWDHIIWIGFSSYKFEFVELELK